MSLDVSAPARRPAGSPDAPVGGSWWRRNRTALLLSLVVVVVVTASAIASIGDDSAGGALDPRNADPNGARAVARVLAEQGVEVQVVRGQAAYLRTRVDADTAVVVSDADQLGASTLNRLRSHGARSPAVILLGPSADVLGRLGIADLPGGDLRGELTPGCDTDLFRGVLVDVPPVASLPAPGCYAARGAGSDGGVLYRTSPADSSIALVSDGSVISNDRVLDGDNAAFALRLLGQRPRLVWYVADAADTTSTDAVSIRPLLPRWLVPGLWLVLLTTIGVALWRGRRLGPLVREPLPVVVRATESTESRGRLYRRTRDRDHAARTLRAATRRRLAYGLSLPRDIALARLVLEAARASGRTPDEVGALLDDRPVTDEPALADLGRGLLTMENEVRDR